MGSLELVVEPAEDRTVAQSSHGPCPSYTTPSDAYSLWTGLMVVVLVGLLRREVPSRGATMSWWHPNISDR